MKNLKEESAQEAEQESEREAAEIGGRDFALGEVKGSPIVLQNAPPSL